MVVQQRVVILEFLQEKMSSHPSTLELTPKKDVFFIIGDWNAKVGQEMPGVTGKFFLVVQNEAGQRQALLQRQCTGHSKHSLPRTQEKTLHMEISQKVNTKIRLIILIATKDGELYTLIKNKIRS